MTNIISIKDVQKGLSVKDKPKNRKRCWHEEKVLIDEHFRILECENCGAKINAFDYLVSIARRNDMMWDKRKEYEKEAIESAKRLEDLKRKERNARSRLKRLENKLREHE